ncbi:hypothetical protein J4709_07800 [Actinomadura sp. LCR2-06]|uniref:STAS domain-containing protein n=1 Tax=Actinomadura violacea TaxID=2819934 RepID=A0ABS3RL62_9ACTN|nr:hypothetical protein [Actinomadura violacea]
MLEPSGLELIDCTGLSVMIWARKQLRRKGAVLQVRNARPAIGRVLEFGGLTDPTVLAGERAVAGAQGGWRIGAPAGAGSDACLIVRPIDVGG